MEYKITFEMEGRKRKELAQAISEVVNITFSKEKRINQKELVEIALVDFFMKYSEAETMEEFLK